MYLAIHYRRIRRTKKATMTTLILFHHFQGFFILSKLRFALSKTRHFKKTSVVKLYKITICKGKGLGTWIVANMWKRFALWVNFSTPKDLKIIWNSCEIPRLQRTSIETTPMSTRRDLAPTKAVCRLSVWLLKIWDWQHCRHRWRQVWLPIKKAVKPQGELMWGSGQCAHTGITKCRCPDIHLLKSTDGDFHQLRWPQKDFNCTC